MKIEINNLTFKCIIGILKKERIKKQRVIVNLSFEYAFNNDDFIDYSHIAKEVETSMKKEKFQLIEDALLYLNERLTTRYAIKNLNICISKPDILSKCQVAVSL
jgi:dihydroneopterin aldolase